MSLAYPLQKKNKNKPYTEELYQSEESLAFKNYLLHTGKAIILILFYSVLFSYFCALFFGNKEPSICSVSFFTLGQTLRKASQHIVLTVLEL